MSNSNEQGFRGVPGVPYGWALVRIGSVYPGEDWLTVNRTVEAWEGNYPSTGWAVVLRKIETPKRYRQFANAEEFSPFRDRWWRYKSEKFTSRPPRGYDDCGWISGDTWERLFDAIVFDDGTPFGVEVTE
jgi:hypothetical protein